MEGTATGAATSAEPVKNSRENQRKSRIGLGLGSPAIPGVPYFFECTLNSSSSSSLRVQPQVVCRIEIHLVHLFDFPVPC